MAVKKTTRRKRTSYLHIRDSIPLKKGRAVLIWGYDPAEKFQCRLEVSHAGIAVYSGEKGGKLLRNVTWEGLVKALTRED